VAHISYMPFVLPYAANCVKALKGIQSNGANPLLDH